VLSWTISYNAVRLLPTATYTEQKYKTKALNIQASSGIRTDDLLVWTEDSSHLRIPWSLWWAHHLF
jgi:hypothetical protein